MKLLTRAEAKLRKILADATASEIVKPAPKLNRAQRRRLAYLQRKAATKARLYGRLAPEQRAALDRASR